MLVAHGAFLSNHFSAKKADQFQIDGPVTLISKWRSATARKKDAAGPTLLVNSRGGKLPVLYSREPRFGR